MLPAAWVYFANALCWFSVAASGRWPLVLLALAPGLAFAACGSAAIRNPENRRLAHLAALAAAASALLTFPLLAAGHGAYFSVVFLASAASWMIAGRAAAIPDAAGDLPSESPVLWAHAGADAAILGSFHLSLVRVPPGELARVREELTAARSLCREAGWLDNPTTFHTPPSGLPDPLRSTPRRSAGLRYEWLRAKSTYVPAAEACGALRWRARVRNRTTHAWWVPQENPDAPWVICVHGFGLGRPLLDFHALAARRLHRAHGCNLLFPVLALHGPRARGVVSGDGFFSGDPVDTLNAVAQSVHDIRHWLAWVLDRAHDPPAMFGVSLGAYLAALVAALEAGSGGDRIGRVLLGTPLVDIEEALWLHGPAFWHEAACEAGINREDVRDLFRAISPLSLPPPAIPAAMFVAQADRLIPPGQAQDLARHWKDVQMARVPSAHVTYRLVPELRGVLRAHLPGGPSPTRAAGSRWDRSRGPMR
ncbi:MAG: hypothetical protein HKP27_10690 [Myxococcales bacterium]|nr:hypothetical protein [Myxococcales bacterium]